MGQTGQLLKALKSSLKAHNKTYADVAMVLGLTEASVKRLFSEQSFSLLRLEQVCQMLDMEISDLIQLMHEQQPRLHQLSHAQEEELVNDLALLLVTVCVLNRWTLKDIVNHYKLSEMECIQKLAHLDRLKIIELLPKNRIKLLVAPNFSWRDNGPIQNFFQQTVAQEYFNVSFNHSDECLLVLNGMLSRQSNGEFQKKLQRLAREFDTLNNDDAALPLQQRNGVTVVMGLRGWRYGLFKHLIRH